MIEEHVYDLLPGYALGCLDEADLLKVAAHLPRCQACREALEPYWSTVDQIALAVPERIPSSDLKQKILQRVTAAEQPQPEQPAQNGFFQKVFGWFMLNPVPLALGGLALVLFVLLAASNWLMWQQLGSQRALNQELAQQVSKLQADVTDRDMQIVRLQGTDQAPQARGYLMIFQGEDYGTLVIEDAPLLDPNHQYQLWLIRDGKRTSGGVFSVDDHGYGTLQISADQPLNAFPSFGVTVEPAGGSPGPTGEKVLGGDL